MKICIVSDFFVPHYQGGGERRYYEIAKRMVKNGHSVDVICMKISGVVDFEEIEGINIHHIGPEIKKPPERKSSDFIKFICSVFKWILTHSYDVIDAQTYAPLFPSFIGAKIKKTPIIATIHDVSTGGDDQWIQSSKTAAIVEKILARMPYNKIITVSNETKNSLIEYYRVKEDRVCVVYNGVDIKLIDSVQIDEKYKNTIIFVGRLAPHKHVNHLIKIMKSLKKEIADVKLLIVGTGVEKDNLTVLTKNYGLQDNVKFLENLDYIELITEMKKSNMLVLPSTREGFGMVLAEANACKIPVVAYASGGVVEVVKNGINGFLVEPEDLNSLEKHVKLLLNNDFESLKLGKNGYNIVKSNFNWDNITKDILNIYTDSGDFEW
ncbi:glycosyltransferase family 4 protein [Methanobacterium alcaliphilum]|uniref:glycosyltransferase family 4 protein n=1 Tax=Methanobacterium alcaliphilum TaxID=392018 RepID=UPI00200AC891|nr:glycosyltransferase family 4 protein [Methanobacterium alcaliphilum]MCK9151632.1 glycosyltransferase family 4 protein [Methanobacterium alcaliphilum]